MDKIFANWILYKKIPTKFWEMKKLSIKVDEFIQFLEENRNWDWINLNINKWKDSWKYYIELDTRVPNWDNSKQIESEEDFENRVKSEKKEITKPKKIEEEISIEDLPF